MSMVRACNEYVVLSGVDDSGVFASAAPLILEGYKIGRSEESSINNMILGINE